MCLRFQICTHLRVCILYFLKKSKIRCTLATMLTCILILMSSKQTLCTSGLKQLFVKEQMTLSKKAGAILTHKCVWKSCQKPFQTIESNSYPWHKGFVNPPVCPHCHCTKLWLLWPVQESLILLFLSTRRNHEGVRRSKYTTLNPNPDVLHHVMYSLHNPSESERPFSPLEEPVLPALGRRGGGARNGFPCCAPATPLHWPRRS